MLCCTLLYVHHLDGEEREILVLLSLSSWCLVVVVWLFSPCHGFVFGLVIVVFPDHTHLLFSFSLFMRTNGKCNNMHAL